MLAAARRIFFRLAPTVALALWSLATLAAGPMPAAAGQTPLETAFSVRAGETLRQFGYELFPPETPESPARASVPPPSTGVQADYRLGGGDELLVTLRGQKSFSKRFRVDANGQLVVDDLRPVAAAGLTLAQLRDELAALVAATLPNTESFVALTELRRIGVLVTGAVRRPGRQEVGAFATLIDALSAAGGVERAGSLRGIRLVRAGASSAIDLYDLLLAGGNGATTADQTLRDGDRLFVPPLGATVAVAGPVKRPGIYELAPDSSLLSAADLRELAGGALRPGRARLLRLGIGAAGEEVAEEVAMTDAKWFGDGDLLMLAPEREDRRDAVRLEGHVLRPGPRARAQAGTLSGLVTRADLRPDPYLPFAALETADPTTQLRALRPVDLGAVLRGRDRRALADGDTLHVLGADDVDFLTAEPVLALLRGERTPPPGSCAGLVALARALAAEPDGLLATGPQAGAAATLAGSRRPCPPLFDRVPDLLPLALSHSVLRLTGVARPGFYPLASRAGGATEATPRANSAIPGSAIPGSAIPDSVIDETRAARYELLGHVRRPGTRPLARGTTLRAALAQGRTLERDVYPLLGIIERYDRRTLTRAFLPFSPQEVAAGRADRALADGDRIHLFAVADMRGLARPPKPAHEGPAHDESARPDPVRPDPARIEPASAARPQPDPLPPELEGEDANVLAAVIDPAIVALIGERVVQVRGAVREPGGYPVADRTPLSALVAAAGGLSADADPTAVELTSAGGQRSAIDLSRGIPRGAAPGDALRVNPRAKALEARAVAIEGAVRRPGRYDVARGESLSSLIQRAGGLLEDAYPAGAVLTRESERRREKEQFQRQARELERTLALEVEKGEPVKAENVALARQLAAQLRGAEPLGRIVVEADPAVLRQRPELDPLLEPDDRIVIPKRPLTVAVSGEVLHPTAAQFVSGKGADAYLEEAGGPTRDADTGRSFLILPDGRARPLSLSSWNHRVEAIPPGSVLVVPRDPRPYDALDITKSVGNILSQLAITAASVSVIAR